MATTVNFAIDGTANPCANDSTELAFSIRIEG